mgnify:CR=1 FL=1
MSKKLLVPVAVLLICAVVLFAANSALAGTAQGAGSVLKLHAGLLRHRLYLCQGPPAKSLILRGPFLFVLGGSQFRLR